MPPPSLYVEESPSAVSAVDLDGQGAGLVVYASGLVRKMIRGVWSEVGRVPPLIKSVFSLKFTSGGDLWIGTEDGAWLFQCYSTRWRTLRTDDALIANWVNTLLLTTEGDLWVGTSEGLVIHRADGSIDRIKEIDGRWLHTVTGLAQDREGAIWVSSGADFNGAYRWREGRWDHFGVDEGLLAPRIHAIVPDRDGRLWFLGLGSRFGQPKGEPGAFVRDNGRFVRWGEEEGLLNGRVYDFLEGNDGEYWFATNGGLSRWQEGRWTHWTSEDNLFHIRIFTLAMGPSGRLWLGHQTGLGGLGYLDDDGRVHYLDRQAGLVHDDVRDLAFDEDGTLWIGTFGGLAMMKEEDDPQFSTIRLVGCPPLWPVIPTADQVYMGTAGWGVMVLDPSERRSPPPAVEVHPPLTDARGTFIRWDVFSYRGEVRPAHCETRYRLDAGNWSSWGTVHEAMITDVPPGNHTLTVQSKSLLGNVSAQGAGVAFVIARPFLRSPLFIAAVVLWAAGMLLLGRHVYTRQRRHRLQLQQRDEELRQAQKMEAIGQLAGGVAHDFNNVLTVILGNAELLRLELRDKLPFPAGDGKGGWSDSLDQIISAGEQASSLTKQLLTFGRRQVVEVEVLDPNEIVEDLERMLTRVVSERIEIRTRLSSDVPPIRADAGHIRQALLNICLNGRDAMPEGGTLTIETAVAMQDAAAFALPSSGTETQVAVISVSDTGVGMSEEIRARAFEPFFTTKTAGQGSGLGLATAYSIVQQAGGVLKAESELGRGSTFRVCLPATSGRVVRVAEKLPDKRPATGETILICEDEEYVRDLVRRILGAAGYNLIVAERAEEAVELARQHGGHIHLLVTDVVMPGMNGRELAAALAQTRPDLHVLYISGYSADMLATEGVLDEGVELLKKPFGRKELLDRVGQQLQRALRT